MDEPFRLKSAREEIGWSKRHLGSKIGTTHGNISQMERGLRAIRADVLEWVEMIAEVIASKPPPPRLKAGWPPRKIKQ